MSDYRTYLNASAALLALSWGSYAAAADFNIPQGDLKAALDLYTSQTGTPLLYATKTVAGIKTSGVTGELNADQALARILSGTGFVVHRDASGVLAIVRHNSSRNEEVPEIGSLVLAQATPPSRAVETVTVTSSKLGGADVQSIPIAITALSQEQLTSQQIAGGPDLIKSVPNLTFTKTNFTGYSIQIRGIGTQAISVTTDPAVAVAFNDQPFIRNHFFEQEFYDVGQVEVLRGPQGTLYGRNATAGVVNVISAKPTDQWEAMASVDVGNYNQRRLEGMLNIPVIGDKLDIRAAAEWTKRDGYAYNETTDRHIDGRDLWSGRLTIGFKPVERLQAYLIWEHFQEDDDRARSTKQLCKKDPGPTSVDGYDFSNLPNSVSYAYSLSAPYQAILSQGCLPTSLYSPQAFQTPNGLSNPIVFLDAFMASRWISMDTLPINLMKPVDPYASITQPTDLRTIQSEIDPTYGAKNDTIEFNADLQVTPSLTLTSQTGYSRDRLRSTEDFNRFNTTSGIFNRGFETEIPPDSNFYFPPFADEQGNYCDPQLGCSTKMVGEDLSQERAWQFNQEVRLASKFEGPFNFSLGANYTHYQTVEDYYVFLNLITAGVQWGNKSGPGDFAHCYPAGPGPFGHAGATPGLVVQPIPFYYSSSALGISFPVPSNLQCFTPGEQPGYPGTYIDPNPIDSLDGQGHNYFRSQNPYRLNSFAGFGEAYYQVSPDLKLTAGLRWTDDSKRFWNIPSWVYLQGGGYPVDSVIDQQWKELTGRFNATWTPKLDFTDQSLFYASYARGYKGGGANPPGPVPTVLSPASLVAHPLTFEPEFVNAYELGTKNALLDSSLTVNADIFFYDYKNYQISQIVDRTSINLNFDAKVKGAEAEATWEPLPGLRFNFSGGYQDSSVNDGQSAIDLIDRTGGHSDWMIVRPSVSETSNCILPSYVMREILQQNPEAAKLMLVFNPCDTAYGHGGLLPGNLTTAYGITDFDPSTAPNGGAGFSKDLSGNELPNTPHVTLSFGAQYSMPINDDWAGTLRGDFYLQSGSWARIFNDDPYDRLHGYKNVNFTLIFTNQAGWQAMAYVKNVFNTTAITGAFLNSDDTSLTTNVFVTDPRLFGIRLTKNW